MSCPACGVAVHVNAWFCQICGHQLKTNDEIQAVVEDMDQEVDVLGHDTVTHDVSTDALILGELSHDFDASSDGVEVLEGALTNGEGGAARYVIYAETTATKQISPGAVPSRQEGEEVSHLTAFEERLLALVDGRSSVAEIQAAGALDKTTMLVALLALLDRGVISFETHNEERLEPPIAEVDAPRPRPRPVAPMPVAPEISGLEDKAAKLFEVAQRDRAAGQLEAARRNATLAKGLDPTGEGYDAFLDGLAADDVGARPAPQSPIALRLYEEAAEAERRGDVDRAIAHLERGLAVSREAMIFNRLGVILATRKRDFERARLMLEEATRLAPENPAYVHNLSKVLAAAPGSAVKKPRPSLWSRLLRRK